MKLWQDRGEVEDSEGDEDLSLDADAPSPERPHKRAKYGREGGVNCNISERSHGSNDEDEGNWIQAKVATTYGRRGTAAKEPSAPVSRRETPGKGVDGALSATVLDAIDRAKFGVNFLTQASRELTPSNIARIALPENGFATRHDPAEVGDTRHALTPAPCEASQSPAAYANERSGVPDATSTVKKIVQPQFSASVLLKHPTQREVSFERSFETLEDLPVVANISETPDIIESQSRGLPKANPSNPLNDDFTRLSDFSSSPLSERDVSPPLHFSHQTAELSSRRRDDTDALSETESIPRELSDLDAQTFATAANERRNLRARQEKQLHPYMYDKAQYQKQFRERGLKPVRVVEQASPNEETQSASQSAASQSSVASHVPSLPMGPTLPPSATAPPQLDYFDAADSSDVEPGFLHRPVKRRRIEGNADRRPGKLPSINTVARPRARSIIQGQQPMPLSPPRTSSDIETPSMIARGFRKTMSGFKLPSGKVLASLPTPQISYDVRPHNADPESPAGSSIEIPMANRRLSDSLSSELSSSESETEALAEAEARRFRREQKRIKGVLPASWLRIDFKKQRIRPSPSPSGQRRLSAEPSPRTEPQKGVARKVFAARSRQLGSPSVQEIVGGASDDSDGSVRELSVSRQSRLIFEEERLAIEPNEAVADDEEMENDFVDPMLAGSSRTGTGTRRRVNQPRITDTFRKTSRLREDLKQDRVPRRQNAKSISHGGSGPRQRRRQGKSRPPPAHLSIIDAPRSPSTAETILPQFVRLAMRRARKEPSRGRHSPTNKVLRLATADETEEASSVLRAWREGTIAPRRFPEPTRPIHQPSRWPGNVEEADRVPLAVLHANVDLPRIRATGLGKPVARMTRPRVNKLMQSRLEYSADEEGTMNEEPPDQSRNAKPPRRRQALQHSHLRSAQLEMLETEFDHMHRAAAFERRMQLLTENVALPERQCRAKGFQLGRYLQANDDVTATNDVGTQATATAYLGLPHRPRKSLARHLETGTRQFRQPSEPLLDLSIDDDDLPTDTGTSEPVLEGLGPFGTKYTADFGIEPLALGTFFQHTTFIGSGEFNDALELANRDLTCAAGRMRVQLDGEMTEWGAWNEDVAANFVRIPAAISEALQILEFTDVNYDREQQLVAVDSNIDYLLCSVSRYCSKCLHFVDAVDRQSCAESLHRLVADLAEAFGESVAANHPLPKTIIKVLQYGFVITKQASQISNHHLVSVTIKNQIESQLLQTSRRLASVAIVGRFDELRSFYEDNKHSDKRATGIDGNAYALSSVVILNNTLSNNRPKPVLWPAICSAMDTEIDKMCAIGRFDKIWYDLFSLLPALEIAATGTVRLGSRFAHPHENWSLPQAILNRVFELYQSSSEVRGYSVNDYVRALLSRCYTLVNKWGWWRCESVLNVIYDFFSRRGLSLLKKEESRGSPRFLDQLGSDMVELEVQNDDRSFHIFLKLLASGVIGMAKYQLYGDRKIQGIAWRFIPNHNRTYRKDADVERSTLDALRNHHDLVCTLYYASPAGHRPGVHLLWELVDHSTSHREACRLNVKSWTNIASFQASTTESLEALAPLTGWFADIMNTTVAQYRLAKSEAQQAFDQAKSEGANPSEYLLESTVTNNQRQLAATIVDALAGLKRALSSSGSPAIARTLVQETAFWTIFELFDPSQRRLISAMTETLQVIDMAMNLEQRSSPNHESQLGSDDSQDFGDSDALQEYAAIDGTNSESASIVDILMGPVGHFMSNILGADVAPDDILLQRAIDVWVRLAGATVKHGNKTWLDYVNDYSTTAWGQMRDTAQKRKFTPYFMARVIEQSTLHVEISHHVLTDWLLSLVEREALLKFQHTFTSAVLTHLGHDRLLHNLPLAKDSKGEYHITLSELRQRRLGVISSVLSNMRAAHERADPGKPADGVRMVYEPMLRQLMQVMKSNYQELQTTQVEAVADASVHGAYVDFVQQVVSFLQQHTTRICKVDRFFTDSTAFPLPSSDPTYVVGRLKGYVPQLRHSKIRKELATFVQAVGERAAVDGQKPYLVNQMATAMKGAADEGDRDSPSLRYLLLTTVFPVYIESAFTTACSWIQVLPVLQACEQVIPDLIYCVKTENDDSVTAATESVIDVLHTINQQLAKILDGFPGMLGFSHVLRILSAMLLVGTSSLAFTSLIKKSTLHGEKLMQQIRALRELTVEIKGRLEGSAGMGMFERTAVADPPVSLWPDTRSYAERQLRGDMQLWNAEYGRYYLKKSGRTQEAVVSLKHSEEEQRGLLLAANGFLIAHTATFSVRSRRRKHSVSENRWIDDVVV